MGTNLLLLIQRQRIYRTRLRSSRIVVTGVRGRPSLPPSFPRPTYFYLSDSILTHACQPTARTHDTRGTTSVLMAVLLEIVCVAGVIFRGAKQPDLVRRALLVTSSGILLLVGNISQ